MRKSPDAFRTISEVADWLGIQAHVLRFWESKFTQVKPIKRAGGRRYYRPGDMALLGGIKKLLHDDGLTIKGVQKILREEGMSHVADMSAPLDELTLSQLDDAQPPAPKEKSATAVTTPEDAKGVVLSFDAAAKPDVEVEKETPKKQDVAEEPGPQAELETTKAEPPKPEQVVEEAPQPKPAEPVAEEPEKAAKVAPAVVEPDPELVAQEEQVVEEVQEPEEPDVKTEEIAEVEPSQDEIETISEATPDDLPEEVQEAELVEEPAPVAALPAFLRRPLADQDISAKKPDVPAQPDVQETADKAPAVKPEPEPVKPEPEPEPAPPAAKKPRIIDIPDITAEADFPAKPAALTAAFRCRKIAPSKMAETKALLQKLSSLRDQMAARRRPSPPSSSQD